MSRILQAFPKDLLENPLLRRLFQTLPEARLVGGCVRDGLLGKRSSDIDLAVPIIPDETMVRLNLDGIKVLPTGIDHGTVTAILDHQPFEITSLRRDVAHDGRWAKVEYTDNWQEDAFRRDLTINALYLDKEGKLFDYATGLDDLKEGRVRFMGKAEQRMREDYLRILRFFRFHSRYAMENFDEEAIAAAELLAGNLTLLSAERVQGEILKLLVTPKILETWREMIERGIVQHFIPSATRLERLNNIMMGEKEHKLKPDPILRLAALLEDDQGAKVALALKLSNQERLLLSSLTDSARRLDTNDPSEIKKAIYRWGNDYVMKRALIDRPKNAPVMIQWTKEWPKPSFPLTGKDLVAAGMREGPEIGTILKQIEDWWIGKDFLPDKEACLKQVLEVRSLMK